jgi:hypothetical protein
MRSDPPGNQFTNAATISNSAQTEMILALMTMQGTVRAFMLIFVARRAARCYRALV